MATLNDFNVVPGETVIVEGTIGRTALLEPQPTGGKYSQLKRFVRLTNASIADDSKGPNLAKFIAAHISSEDPHWYTATSSLENIQVIDESTGQPITITGELARDQKIKLAINAFKPKNYDNLGSGLQAISVPSASALRYVGQNVNAASLFGIGDIASATTPTQAPVAQEATKPAPETQPAPAPEAEANPFASNGAAESNPFAK